MAGPVPAIHVSAAEGVDARAKPGHDGCVRRFPLAASAASGMTATRQNDSSRFELVVALSRARW